MTNFSYIQKYTFEEYKNWEGKWELIDGTPYAMVPLPSIKHQNISGNIHALLKMQLENCEKCTPLLPVDWKIDEETVLQPDNCVICYSVDEKATYLTKAPSLIFEILSPSTANKDRILKFQIYQEQKVKYYAMIEPKNNTYEIYVLNNDIYEKIESDNNCFTFLLEECEINFDFAKILK